MVLRVTFFAILAVVMVGISSASAQNSLSRQDPLPNPAVPVVGHSMDYHLVPDFDDGVPVPGGGYFWTHVIWNSGVTFVKAHLVELNLRPGDQLVLRSPSGRVIETLTGRGPKDRTTFWSLSSFGDEMILEFSYQEPYGRAPFRIDRAIFGIHDLFERESIYTESICSPAQFEDVLCYQADTEKWNNVWASVGVMSVGGDADNALWCSGSNISPLNYVLTNDHCISSQSECDNSEFVFRYFRQGCNDGSPPTDDWESFRCDDVLASSPFISCDQGLNDLDFALCSVIGDPASTYGWVTPDPNPITDGEAIYIVQHPGGRPHEITHGNGIDVDADGTVLRYYDTLDTEGGSSGSPIFRESDDLLIGLHHCGGCSSPGVGNRGMLMSDIYPHIAEFLCATEVDIIGATLQDLIEVSGNGDSLLDPGETWSFVPHITNNACDATALNVRASLAVSSQTEGILLIQGPDPSFGNVLPGETKGSNQPVVFEIDPTFPCGGIVGLDLVSIQADNGGPFADIEGALFDQTGAPIEEAILSEDFSSGLGAWSIVNGGTGTGPAETWTADNPGGRSVGLSPPFAICDSGELGSGALMDEQLISPAIDASIFGQVTLQFRHNFRYWASGLNEIADVDVRSSMTGGLWTNVARYQGADASGAVTLDISAQAAGANDLEIRFHYYNAEWEWWWAIDEVLVMGEEGSLCSPLSFTPYGQGCVGPSGFTPMLSGSGNATPGSTIQLDIREGLPASSGYLFFAVDDATGSCVLIQPPFLGPLPLTLDGLGELTLSGPLPNDTPVDFHLYLQYFGIETGGWSSSNGLDLYIQ